MPADWPSSRIHLGRRRFDRLALREPDYLGDYWQRFLKSVRGWRIPLMSDSTPGLALR
jgi:hypothetical protein